MTVPLQTTIIKPAPAVAKTKVIHVMRHGITEMNMYLKKNPYHSWGFRDPKLYDTRLTQEGQAGAQAAAARTAGLTPKPEVLIVSPLSRALHTAQLAFPDFDGPIEVEALATERVYLSAEVGKSPSELRREFPDGRYNFDHLPDIWWYNGDSKDNKKVVVEPDDVFKARVKEFKKYLLNRPEAVIAVVAHYCLLLEMTGQSFENCEVRSFELKQEA